MAESAQRVGAAAIRQPRQRAAAYLPGRDTEIAALIDAVNVRPAFVTVRGEAGIGKTALVNAALSVTSIPVLRAAAQPLSEPFPFGPLVQALGQGRALLRTATLPPAAGAVRSMFPDLADILPPEIAAPAGDPRAERHRAFQGLTALIEALGRVLLVIEDVHWADDSTIDLLGSLAADMPPHLGIVATFRDDEDGASAARLLGLLARTGPVRRLDIELAVLDESGVAAMVSDMLATGLSTAFARYLHAATGGLPFAIQESVRFLQERDDIQLVDGVWCRRDIEELHVPPRVRDSIVERLHRLPDDAQRIVETAAVLRLPVDDATLQSVTAIDGQRFAEALASGFRAGLLSCEGTKTAMRHALAQQAVYGSLDPGSRRHLHRTAVAVFESSDERPWAQLTHHAEAAGMERERAAFAEHAADAATLVRDFDAATSFFLVAAAAPTHDTATRVRLATKLAETAFWSRRSADARGVVESVLDSADLAPGDRGKLAYLLARLLAVGGDLVHARERAAAAVADLDPASSESPRAMALIAVSGAIEGCSTQHLPWLYRAMAAVRDHPDSLTRVTVLVDAASVLLMVGDPQGLVALEQWPSRAASPAEHLQLERGHVNVAFVLTRLGYSERAEFHLEWVKKFSRDTDAGHSSALLGEVEMLRAWHEGAWDLAATAVSAVLDANASPRPAVRAMAVRLHGCLLLSRGDAEAEGVLREALVIGEEAPDVEAATAAAGALCRLLLTAGRTDAALDVLNTGLAIVRREGSWAATSEFIGPAVNVASMSSRAFASDLLQEIDADLQGRISPAAWAALTMARATFDMTVAETATAIAGMASAAQCWRDLGRPYFAALADELRGLMILDDGGTEEGALLLRTTHDALQHLGASWDAARLTKAMRDRGLQTGRGRGRPSYGGDLSPREAQVAQLAAAGRSNREIAETLFLSPRTVEDHVSRALRKLGLTSRLQLVATPGVMPIDVNSPRSHDDAGLARQQ